MHCCVLTLTVTILRECNVAVEVVTETLYSGSNTSVFAHYTSYVNTQRTLPTLLILALHGGEQSDSHTSCLTLREEPFL